VTRWRSPYPRFGAGNGFARIACVASRLQIDLKAFGASGAVVVGSNGKGSTAAMCASILASDRRCVGLFTSPHLLRANERFRLDGEDISDLELERHWRRVQAAIEAEGLGAEFGGFEFLFLIAADWFAHRECLHTVWEAGIGGRLDPTRLIHARRGALTSLDHEHTELLGERLEDIACDKADAVAAGGKLFVGPVEKGVLEALVDHCRSCDIGVYSLAPNEMASLSLTGGHQRSNAALAARLAADMADVSQAVIANGLALTRWPGRLEQVEDDPPTLIDVGHTPGAVCAALAGFEEWATSLKRVLVCGVSRDKRAAEIVALLAPRFDVVICVAAYRGVEAADIAQATAAANPTAEIVAVASIGEARDTARRRARALDASVYVAGGLYLAAEYKAATLGLVADPALF
jgi:dihydrofolate synthase/folylpolyglutamate synthase